MVTKKTRGFTLIELSIVMAISMMLLAATMWSRVNGIREEQAKIQGDAILVLSNAVATYMTNNYSNLVNNTAIGGYANIYIPTVAELTASGLLSNNFNTTNIYGSGYQISVSRVPAGCVPPNCDVVSLTNLTAAVIDYRTGLIDGPSLGAAANRIGANGGWSTRATPGTIAGVDGSWSAANPVTVAGVPVAGILGVRAGYGSSGWAQFLRRDGTLPMTGALNMGAQNINSANGVNAATLATTGAATIGGTLGVTGVTSTNGISNTGAVNTTTIASSAGATIGTTLAVAGATTTNGITNTGAVSTGTLSTTGAVVVGSTLNVTGATTTNGITNTGNITATGDLTGARLLPTTVVASGQSCVGLNGYQARTSAGSLASCINGQWVTPNATVVATPCAGQSQAWGSCSAYINGTIAGASSTVSATSPSGATGSATFMCTNGVQVLQAGSSCTLPPCPATTLSWGGGCQASFPSTSVGSSSYRSATTGTGSATYVCNSPGGSGGWSYQSGSCTPPAVGCSAGSYKTWSQYQGAWLGNSEVAGTYNCSGYSGSYVNSGSTIYINNSASSRTGGATFTCNNGSLTTSGGTCDGTTTATSTTMVAVLSGTYTCLSTTNRNHINAEYRRLLRRIPDGGGLTYWCGQMNAGMTPAMLTTTIMSLAEYGQAQYVGHVVMDNTRCPGASRYPWTITSQGNVCKYGP